MNKKKLVFAIMLIGFDISILLSPNQIIPGGVTGLGIIAQEFNISISIFVFLTNLLIVIIGFIFINRSFLVGSLLTGLVLLPLSLWIFNWQVFSINVPYNIILTPIIGGLLLGYGAYLLATENCSLGGTMIIGKIISDRSRLNLFQASSILDSCIIIGGGLIFGFYSIISGLITIISCVSIATYLHNKQLGVIK